jgi:hypothetical protein
MIPARHLVGAPWCGEAATRHGRGVLIRVAARGPNSIRPGDWKGASFRHIERNESDLIVGRSTSAGSVRGQRGSPQNY